MPIAYDVGDIKGQLEGLKLTVKNFRDLKKKFNQVILNYNSFRKKIILLKKKKLKMVNTQLKDFDKIFLSK